MKFLFTLTYYSPYVSGLTIYVKRVAETLVKKGHQVRVLCIKHLPELPDEEIIGGVRVVRANPDFKINKGFISLNYALLAFREIKNTELLLVNLPQAEGFIGIFLAKLMGKKTAAVYHCEVQSGNKIVQALIETANLAALLSADRVVTYTKDYADKAGLLKYVKNKLEIISPPIPDLPADPGIKNKLKNRLGKGKIIGVAARLAAEKGIEYLLEAIPLINKGLKGIDFKIAIAGPTDPVGENDYKRKIFLLLEKYKSRVILLGSIPPEQMGSFYSLIDVLVLPSINRTEAFGMVQAEAMKAGVPVVATDLPGVRIPIQKTNMGILVPPKNPAAIAEAIIKIINNRESFIFREKANKEFDMEKTIIAYENL